MNNLEDMVIIGWDHLPDIALSNIFKHLNENERYNASLVCKNWSRAFKFPELWRKMKFTCQSLMGEKACKFASSYGECLRELDIDCHGVGSSWKNAKFSNFLKFLSILTEKQVINIEKFIFTNFNSIKVKLHKDESTHLCAIAKKLIHKFLGKQNNVRHFDMEKCAASLEIGIQFLSQLAMNSSHSLKVLHLKNFFVKETCEVLPLRSLNYREIFSSFDSLVELHINFNFINSEILTRIAKSCGTSLEIIKFWCNEEYTQAHVIPNSTWASVKKLCPKLEVEVNISNLCYLSVDFYEVIPSEMGLRSYTAVMNVTNVDDDDDNSLENLGENLSALVDQLCKFPETMSYVFLEWDYFDDGFDDTLFIKLVSTCPGLKFLHFSGAIEFGTFKVLCEMQEQGQIHLEKCEFDITYHEEDYTANRALIREIENLIECINQKQGMQFNFYYQGISSMTSESDSWDLECSDDYDLGEFYNEIEEYEQERFREDEEALNSE